MLLAIDIGNTKAGIAVFKQGKIILKKSLATKSCENPLLLKKFLKIKNIDDIRIVSVVPKLDKVFRNICRKLFKINPVFATHRTIGITIKNYPKKQVGADRLVNAFAAYKIYKRALIVIDAGSGITFDVVSKTGEFLGGAIAPGVGIQAKALHEMTAKLPLVSKIKKPTTATGNSTLKCIQSGIYFGVGGLVDNIVKKISYEMKTKPLVIATGGDAKLIRNAATTIQILRPNLTLEGLEFLCPHSPAASPLSPSAYGGFPSPTRGERD